MRPPESMSPNNKSIRFLPDTLPGESWERTVERGSLCICLPPGGRGPWHSFIEKGSFMKPSITASMVQQPKTATLGAVE